MLKTHGVIKRTIREDVCISTETNKSFKKLTKVLIIFEQEVWKLDKGILHKTNLKFYATSN